MKIKDKMKDKTELKSLINDYCKDKGISKADFARRAGVSGATLSSIEGGRFDLISETMANRLFALLNEAVGQTIYKTRDFNAVQKACEVARQHHFMIGITGDTGTGKTTALTHFARNRGVYKITLTKSMHQRFFLDAFLKELGQECYGSLGDKVAKIVDFINAKANALILIDEAGKMTPNVMLLLHDIREATRFNCGIVMAGMPYFRTNLERNAKRQQVGFAEFMRRVNLWQELDGLNRTEIEAIIEDKGYSKETDMQQFAGFRRFADLENKILLDNILIGGI